MDRSDRMGPLGRRLAVATLAMGVALGGAEASSLRIASTSDPGSATEVEADYTTSRFFLDETAGESALITVFLDPQVTGVEAAEVFTNLNRRDKATADPDGRGIAEGISSPPGNGIAPGDDRHYYKAYPMSAVPGGYRLTLKVERCGAYRLTARYRLQSDPSGTYRWYGDERNHKGVLKRDHAIVVSPARARTFQIYEANPLTVTATGLAPAERGTFAKLARVAPGAGEPRFSLAYLKQLGVNTLWLQPLHPRGIAGRQTDSETGKPFLLGSPYAVKNFFAVMPLMASTFTPGRTPASDDTEAGRAQALDEFRDFADAANGENVGILFDVPFNHAAHDVELSAAGQRYWGNPSSPARAEIRDVEARVFSRRGAYDMRAADAASVGVAPDRNDFGKWSDVADVYFGRYAALVPNAGSRENYRNEEDWFDYSVGAEDGSGMDNGHFDRITQNVWQFFGEYVQFWLTETGYPQNPTREPLRSTFGLSGLRADFAQGLPPQAWEYIVNRTRTRRWDFVFMAESLDGGPVTYRSSRHFDVLNDNLVFDLHRATSSGAFERVYEDRRKAYGLAPMLLNTSSHDEDNYKNPYEALLRHAVNNTIDGVPMIFQGQELGLRGTIVPPHDSNPAAGSPSGYERYDAPFGGKPIPHFKTYASMMPLWRALDRNSGDALHLLALYTAIGQARSMSPALRSPNRWFLRLTNGSSEDRIFAVGKYEKTGADPNASDVVFAFVNLSVGSDVATPPATGFNVSLEKDHRNLFGIRADRQYNVKNIAAYARSDPRRRERCLWGGGRSGADLLANGIFVRMNRVPTDEAGWTSAPYEAQYLKLIDVTSSDACSPQ